MIFVVVLVLLSLIIISLMGTVLPSQIMFFQAMTCHLVLAKQSVLKVTTGTNMMITR